jgi:hypothetical protein
LAEPLRRAIAKSQRLEKPPIGAARQCRSWVNRVGLSMRRSRPVFPYEQISSDAAISFLFHLLQQGTG